MDYEWDPKKAAKNVHKHNVSFEEAASVFDDPLYVDLMTPIIPWMSVVTLLLVYRPQVDYCWFRIPKEKLQFA